MTTPNNQADAIAQSLDTTQERIDQLKAIFPDAFSEGKIDFNRLKAALGDDSVPTNERYELSWAGKAEARREIQKRTTATLRPDMDNSVNWNATQNLYIEGENLEVLRTLQKAYFGRVKMIYIDPPYNTGNDSFVYPDDYTERLPEYRARTGLTDEAGFVNKQDMWRKNTKENGQFHSVWLSMMYPRLFLARNLLQDDGVIAIHIDEHEYVNLAKILDEVFGEENELGTVVWDKRNPKGDAIGVSYQHEYLIFYTKDRTKFAEKCAFTRRKPNAEKMLKKAAQLIKSMGINDAVRAAFKDWIRCQMDLSGGERAYCLVDSQGEIYQSVSMAWPNKQRAPADYLIPLIHPTTQKPCPLPSRGWRNPSKTMKELLKNNEIIFGEDEKTQPRRKYLLRENMSEKISSLLYFGGSDDSYFEELGLVFENPKPFEVAKKIIDPLVKKDEIILDFFSGSGTTAQAVLELNEEDGGNRQFICVQMSETLEEDSEAYKAGYRTIADIGRARIKKVIERMEAKRKEENKQGKIEQSEAPKQNLGFNAFKLAPSNFKEWRSDLDTVEELFEQLAYHIDSTRPDSEAGSMVYELLLKMALPLTTPIQCHTVEQSRVYVASPENTKPVVMFFDAANKPTLEFILKTKPSKVLCLNKAFVDSQALMNFAYQLKDVEIALEVL